MLYKRSFTLPLLCCAHDEEAAYVLQEIHEGVCGNHSGCHVLSHKALTVGYSWPIIPRDAREMVQIAIITRGTLTYVGARPSP